MNKKIFKEKRFITWARIINGLTISRILLGLPILILLSTGNNEAFILLILIAGLTDYLDGYFARKYDHKSAFGAKLDPLADKILLIGPMIWLAHENLVPLWSIWLIISREFLITSWRSDKTSGGPASIQGKYKTTFQFASIILLLWPKSWATIYTINIINKIGYISFWIAFFLTLTSAMKYIFNQKETHQN
ncbi:CDP-diacylglycerol--glycerol-3-phosphate 3-phosphatidyltransferase [Prochlorococcus sp. MIT 0801]|uniref:CDP-diacylglycerol--glycerol-3-phosphate 3-phosphatidyltransferase n=1 Tax=Prochlorococcus sp. MIT 0801 TaxID=1501269 RepID=UPI0004F634F5|nr:CDP-diacylglycerol--glycerol-3-phosphate 3-phosphatidyltransferase [Prochlorococcus sp. MIT 0801]AIQ96981.1 CDP-diacylglycerol--glycerol-3-phosphate 3-phosphatidyltransferase [Prochlorococcus sp. MIT 0801]